MAKKAKEVAPQEVQNEVQNLQNENPFEYGYKQGSSISLPAEVVMQLIDLSGAVARSETKEYFEVLSTVVGEEPKEQQPEVYRALVSPLGKKAGDMFNALMEVHVENIKKGFAVKADKAPLDLGPEPVADNGDTDK